MDAVRMHKIECREGSIDINRYGIQLKLYAKKRREPSDVKEVVRVVTQEISDTCISMGAMGHIKSCLKADSGFIKADTIGSKYGVHIE